MDELRIYLRMLMRSWWIVVLCTLAALSLALIASYLETPLYRATSLFLITPSSGIIETVDVTRALERLSRPELVATYVEIFQSDQIYNTTIRQLGLTNLRGYNVIATALPQTSVIQVVVTGSNAETVALLANSIGQTAITYSEPLFPMFNIGQLDVATEPGSPYSPVPTRTASIAAILGVVIGVALAIIYEQLRVPMSTATEGQKELASDFPENSPWSRWSRKR